MNHYLKIIVSVLLLIPFYTCNKDIYIKHQLISSISGILYYNYDKGNFDTFSFIIDDGKSKDLIKIINASEVGSYTPLSHRFATIQLMINLEKEDCNYYEILISKEIGTYLYEYSDCEGTKFVIGRYKNNKLGEYFIEYFEERINLNN